MSNPYLQAQQNAIANQVNTSLLQTQMPAINRGAVLNGGYGGSRQGVAQGIAMNGANQAIANATANLQGNAYAQDQQIAAQQQMQQAQLAAQQRIAEMQDATQRYGLGNQYQLGLGNLGLGFTQAGNQYQLGLGNLALGNRQADQSYSLGQGQLANQATANANQYSLGLGNLGLGYTQANNQYQLGLGQNANQRFGLENQYNLGLAQNQTQRDLGFGQLGNQATANAQNFYTAQRGQDLQSNQQGFNQYLQALQAQMGLGAQQAAIGQQQQQASFNPLAQFGSLISPFTGLNGSTSTQTPSSGGGLAGAAGGALTMAQLWRLLNP